MREILKSLFCLFRLSQNADGKIAEQNYRYGVDNRRDEGVCNNGRVQMAKLCQDRQYRADELSYNHRCKQSEGYHKGNKTGVAFHIKEHAVQEDKLCKASKGKSCAKQQCGAKLLPNNLTYVPRFHFSKREGADDGYRRLGAGVTARTHDHRYAGNEAGGKLCLVVV